MVHPRPLFLEGFEGCLAISTHTTTRAMLMKTSNSIRILANPKAPQKIVQVSTLTIFKTCKDGIKKPWHSQTFECMEVPKLL
jgi:hypothetical protein